MFVSKSLRLILPGFLLVAASRVTACSDASQPINPIVVVDSTTGHRESPPIAFPEPSRAAAIYNASEGLNDVSTYFHGATLLSRYVFYEDSTFALQFSSSRFGLFEYDGRFSRTNADIALRFNASSTAGPWEATGNVNGDALSVTYNTIMSLSDFIDGSYFRSR